MPTVSPEELRSSLAKAATELRKEASDYSRLLSQLEVLQNSLSADEPPVELLRSTLRMFPAKVQPTRAGTPSGEGLKETRKLWEELNRIVESRQTKEASTESRRPRNT